jgi:hypothetical protein
VLHDSDVRVRPADLAGWRCTRQGRALDALEEALEIIAAGEEIDEVEDDDDDEGGSLQ